MRLASSITLEAYKAAHSKLREGMSPQDFAALISGAHQHARDFGAERWCWPRLRLPHGLRNRRRSARARGADRRRMRGGGLPIGHQPDVYARKTGGEMKRVFDVVHAAQRAALKAARPGVSCGAVDAAARKLIEDAGWGPGYEYFTHRVGHGLGMDGHEWPYLVKGNPLPLAPHMTFSDEPGVYIRGDSGSGWKTTCTSRRMRRSC